MFPMKPEMIYIIITAVKLNKPLILFRKTGTAYVVVLRFSTQTTQINWLYDHMNIKNQLFYIGDHQPAQ